MQQMQTITEIEILKAAEQQIWLKKQNEENRVGGEIKKHWIEKYTAQLEEIDARIRELENPEFREFLSQKEKENS